MTVALGFYSLEDYKQEILRRKLNHTRCQALASPIGRVKLTCYDPRTAEVLVCEVHTRVGAILRNSDLRVQIAELLQHPAHQLAADPCPSVRGAPRAAGCARSARRR